MSAIARPVRLYCRRLVIALLAATAAACGGNAPLPPVPAADDAVAERQKDAFVEAMRPRREGRPVVAILALNDATETTDLLLPHAVLERAGVADVLVVAPHAGAIHLFPTLQVQAELDFAAFERLHPNGADYVIVPAMEPDDSPDVSAWLRRQADRGARVIGVCIGAVVVANAELLDDRRFLSHWYARAGIAAKRPGATFVPHQRYLADRGVATTTGISASVPMTIALVEAIGGTEKARMLAAELGVTAWTPAHDSSRFGLTARRRWDYIADTLAFWRRKPRAIEVRNGTDDIALALTADAWVRSRMARVEAQSATPTVRLRSGLVLSASAPAPDVARIPLETGLKPMQQLEHTLCLIAEQHGANRRDRVEQELEYTAAPGLCGKPEAQG